MVEPTQIGGNIKGVLRWQDEAGKHRSLYLHEGGTADLGRDPDNEVAIDSKHVSRRHAVISWRDGVFKLADLGSTNGTKLNGKLISEPKSLQDNDVICLYDEEITFYESVDTAPNLEEAAKSRETFIIPPDSPQPRLIVSAGVHEGMVIRLRPQKLVIGRATAKADWDIALQDRAISRPHAEIKFEDGKYILTDLDTPNGTLVNGDLIVESVALLDGDVILLGETTLLYRAR